MDTVNVATGVTPAPDPEVARKRRIAQEAEGIARARASALAGRIVTSEAVDAWIESLDTDHELPAPHPGQ
jgi:predicted transcriptional regulator